MVYGEAEVDWAGGAPYPTKELLLDLYIPVGPKLPEKLPGYVFVHGGGFVGGDKLHDGFVWNAREFATRGYVAVSINYRLAGDDPPPTLGGDRNIDAAILDTAMAVNWMRDHADELNVDPDRIVLGGTSAGAIASLFVGTIGGGGPARFAEVAAVVDLMGALFGWEAVLVDSSDPPTFIGISTDDGFYAQTLAIEQEFLEHGVTHTFPLVEGVGHDWGAVLMTRPDETGRTVQDLMYEFLYDMLDLGSLD